MLCMATLNCIVHGMCHGVVYCFRPWANDAMASTVGDDIASSTSDAMDDAMGDAMDESTDDSTLSSMAGVHGIIHGRCRG